MRGACNAIILKYLYFKKSLSNQNAANPRGRKNYGVIFIFKSVYNYC